MALPIIDDRVPLSTAYINMKDYLLEPSGIELIFKIEALRTKIKTLSAGRRAYLEYGLKMYQ